VRLAENRAAFSHFLTIKFKIMKTSNKIFLGLLAAIALNVLTGMVMLRTSLGPKGIGDGDLLINGTGALKTKKLPVSDFAKLSIDGHYNVTLSQGKEFLEITTDENIVDYFTTETTKDGRLILTVQEKYTVNPQQVIEVKLGFKNLSEIEINGKTTISAADTLKFENLYLNMQSLSKANLSLAVDRHLNIWMKDIAEANLTGTAPESRIELGDLAKLKATKLILQETNIQVRDMSYADLNVVKKLNAQAADQGKIEYIGQPKGQFQDRDMGSISKKY